MSAVSSIVVAYTQSVRWTRSRRIYDVRFNIGCQCCVIDPPTGVHPLMCISANLRFDFWRVRIARGCDMNRNDLNNVMQDNQRSVVTVSCNWFTRNWISVFLLIQKTVSCIQKMGRPLCTTVQSAVIITVISCRCHRGTPFDWPTPHTILPPILIASHYWHCSHNMRSRVYEYYIT